MTQVSPQVDCSMGITTVLPEKRAMGSAQMALDLSLLRTTQRVVARRYTWSQPAISLGRFQRLESACQVPFEVVRRPTGGRAVLHGEGFEWSFAVAFPPGAAVDVTTPYDIVAGAFAGALRDLGVTLDEGRAEPYRRSALCFASALRHDILSRGEKLVAIAQAKHEGRTLVHGSVLECRPPDGLVLFAETFLGEPWQGKGLAVAGSVLGPDAIWSRVLANLETSLLRLGSRT